MPGPSSPSPSPYAVWFDVADHADVLLNVRLAANVSADSAAPPSAKRVKLEVEDDSTGSVAAAAAAAAPVGADSAGLAVARCYHCHAIVLATHSGYFKALLGAAWQPEAAAAGPSAQRRTVDVHVEEEELGTMHELLRMLYTQAVPPPPPPPPPPAAAEPAAGSSAAGQRLLQYLQCLNLADRFEAVSSIELLVAALAATPPEAWDCAAIQHAFQASPGVRASASYPALLAACIKALASALSGAGAAAAAWDSESSSLAPCVRAVVQLFGDVPEVVGDGGLMKQFCSLPFAAVLAWAKSDELRVHSENCVVFMLTAWLHANKPARGAHAKEESEEQSEDQSEEQSEEHSEDQAGEQAEEQAEEQAKELAKEQAEDLSRQIRIFHLGPAYLHQILPNLPWFMGCSGMKHLPTVLSCMRAGITMKDGPDREKRILTSLACPPAWLAKPRGPSGSANSTRVGSWKVSASQLEAMSTTTCQDLLPPVYVNGFLVHVRLSMKQAATDPPATAPAGGVTLAVWRSVTRRLMAESGLTMPDGTMVAIGPMHVRVGGPGSQMSKESTLGGSGLLSCDKYLVKTNFFHSSAPTLLELLAPYLQAGQLQVEASITGVDFVLGA